MATRVNRLFTVAVNPLFCKGCEICVQVCPKDIFSMNARQKAAVNHVDTCTGCLSCEVYCPDFAIAVEEVPAHG